MNALILGAKKYLPYLLGDKGKASVPLGVKNLANIANLSYQKERPETYEGMSYVPEYSSEDIATYRTPQGGYNVSIAGTRLNKIGDIKSDINGVILGNKDADKRYNDALQTVERIRKENEGVQIQTFGHSLGASIGGYINEKHPDIRSIGFNNPSNVSTKNTIQFKSQSDPISLVNNSVQPQNAYNFRTWNPHALSNY